MPQTARNDTFAMMHLHRVQNQVCGCIVLRVLDFKSLHCIIFVRATDLCMGSGHILCYFFDVLMQIYESQGYSQRDAAQSILTHNIWGLDIDERAYQLAYFAVMMKARQYDRRILSRGIKPHVYATQESNVNKAQLKKLIAVGEALAQKYSVTCTNPPYMGSDGMDVKTQWSASNDYSANLDVFVKL